MIDEIIMRKLCDRINFNRLSLFKTISMNLTAKIIVNRIFSDVFFLVSTKRILISTISTIKNSIIKLDIQVKLIIKISLTIKTMIIVIRSINTAIKIKIDTQTSTNFFRHNSGCKL